MPAILMIFQVVLALFQVGKEVLPVVKPFVTNTVSQPNAALVYRYCDDNYAYYSDDSGKVWGRRGRNGVVEYAYNNDTIVR